MGSVGADAGRPEGVSAAIRTRIMARTGGKERREQLIAEAIRLFGQRGYDAATLDAVAEAAGVRKQSLLYYFPTKEDLFDACVDELSARVARPLPPDRSTGNALNTSAVAAARHHTSKK